MRVIEVEDYGVFLSNLRNSAGLSLDAEARLVDGSKSTLSRLENNEITPPFKNNARKFVLALAQFLCPSRKDVEKYLQLAKINATLLTEMEGFQLGFHPRLDSDDAQDITNLERWEGMYQHIIVQLEKRQAIIGPKNIPSQFILKVREYEFVLHEIRRKLNRLPNNHQMSSLITMENEEGRVVVGTHHGKGINTITNVNLYSLASPNAQRLMQQGNIDCFAVDDLMTLTQSSNFAGWDREDITLTKLTTPLMIPDAIETLRQEKLPAIQKNFVNSSHYRMAAYTPAFSDRMGLEVTLAPIGFHDYYTLLPYLDEPLLTQEDGSKTSIREQYGQSAFTYTMNGGETCLIPAPVSLQCVLISKDHQIILMQRSNSVAFYPNHWSASYEETMDAPGMSPKREVRSGDTDFFACAIRGIEEEFGIPASAVESVKVLSLNVEYLILAVGVVAVINVDMTVQEIKTHWLIKAPDKNEASKLATVPVDLPSVVSKLFSHGILWHPTSRMRLIQYLFHRYGIDEVAKAIDDQK